MKLHLDSNIIEGTPEEIIKYKELLEVKNQAEEENEATDEHTFWYLEGSILTDHNVLKTLFGGYFEDSKGRRYTYHAVHKLIKPLNREDVREEFEKAKHRGGLLKYYSVQDLFVRE